MAILSIQSHVSYGHVGNAAITFPLQRLGREVWAVHTVMFSAHAGYGPPRGPIFSPQTVRDVVSGLKERGVLSRCKAVLSGYLGDAALGEVVLEAVREVKQANPQALYCCDPVMGDEEPGLYVRKNIPDFICNKALPVADIATPNVFELSLMTGKPIETLEGAVSACRDLISRGCGIVLLTSLERTGTPGGHIEMLCVTKERADLIATPKFDIIPAPNGAGDLTAALFLAFLIETRRSDLALQRTAAAIHAVFKETERQGARELALIAAQESFLNPPVSFPVTEV